MSFPFKIFPCRRGVALVFVLAGASRFAAVGSAADAVGAVKPAARETDVMVAAAPMKFEAAGKAVYGQLVVAPELAGTGSYGDLVYIITVGPRFGRVGMGGDSDNFFRNRTGHLGYFIYQPNEDFAGEDSFSYSVRSRNSGLVFKNRVVISVKPAAPVGLDKAVGRPRADHPVTLTTRPNRPITQKIPSHQDFMKESDRAILTHAQVAYGLNMLTPAQHGSATLDRATGLLTYAPNPGFIGEDRFEYYTFDENYAQLGMENAVIVKVEPVRNLKHLAVDRAKSREVDLVFVINNSPSMAPYQNRIAANLRRFRQLFDARQLDYRIGVLTTDFVDGGADRPIGSGPVFRRIRAPELDTAGNVVLDRKRRPKQGTKLVASNGTLVTLPGMAQPWVTPQTPDGVFAELVKVGTTGDSNRTAFTAVYNFVSDYQHKVHALLRPDAATIVVFFMDEEETRMAAWKDLPVQPGAAPEAEWIENGQLPDLINEYNARGPRQRQTLDGYINYWVVRPFTVVKGNQRGKIEMHAVVRPKNVSHRRAAELTGGTVLNIESDFSAPLAALGDRIADTVAIALDPVGPDATFYQKSLRVLVDGAEVRADPDDGYVYDEIAHSIRFQGAAQKRAFAGKIEITYEEHR